MFAFPNTDITAAAVIEALLFHVTHRIHDGSTCCKALIIIGWHRLFPVVGSQEFVMMPNFIIPAIDAVHQNDT
jgi:hypothetical protein